MISQDSTSYPYLAVALTYNINYGRVLWCAAYLEGIGLGAPIEWQHRDAIDSLPQPVFAATFMAWKKEKERRAAVRLLIK